MSEYYNVWIAITPFETIDCLLTFINKEVNLSTDSIIIATSCATTENTQVAQILSKHLKSPVNSLSDGNSICPGQLYLLESDSKFTTSELVTFSTSINASHPHKVIAKDNQIYVRAKPSATHPHTPPNIGKDEISQIASALSHDVRAPIRHVAQFTKIAKELTTTSDEMSEYLNIMSLSAQDLNEQVLGLVKYMRTGLKQPEFVNTEIVKCLQSAILQHKNAINEDQVIIKSSIDEQTHTDPSLLTEVFYQLIDNSIKFKKTNAQLEIAISCSKIGDTIHIEYQDNSSGFSYFPSENHISIFQKLHSNANLAGAGIGLNLCKKIISNLNGDIQIDQLQTQGVKIRVLLPQASSIESIKTEVSSLS